jgi:methylated-DNA-[protein]-cysteine S-methyltransferase
MSSMRYVSHCPTPIGLLEVVADDEHLLRVTFVDAASTDHSTNAITDAAAAQLSEYFAGVRREFDVPLAPEGTDFQRAVWAQLLHVAYGQTASYREIALALGNLDAVRAVGAANGANPIAVIVPCHRIIGSNGQLTGYGGGLWRKEWLLRHEGALLI